MLNNWREQLETVLDEALDHDEVEAFIQSKFAELIESIPGDLHAEFCEVKGKQYKPCSACIKNQLKKEWLSN